MSDKASQNSHSSDHGHIPELSNSTQTELEENSNDKIPDLTTPINTQQIREEFNEIALNEMTLVSTESENCTNSILKKELNGLSITVECHLAKESVSINFASHSNDRDLLDCLLSICRKKDENELDILFNKLSSQPILSILMYSPAIIHLFIFTDKNRSKKIEEFLSAKCSEKFILMMHVVWLIHFYLRTPIPSFPPISNDVRPSNEDLSAFQKSVWEKLSHFYGKLLNISMNLTIPASSFGETLNTGNGFSSRFIAQNTFIYGLLNISSQSLSISDKSQRQSALVEKLKQLWNTCESGNNCVPWMSYPSNRIVSICFDHCRVLPSKNKAPYLVVFEVIEHVLTESSFSTDENGDKDSSSFSISHFTHHLHVRSKSDPIIDIEPTITRSNISTQSCEKYSSSEHVLSSILRETENEPKISRDSISEDCTDSSKESSLKSENESQKSSSIGSELNFRNTIRQHSQLSSEPGWNIYSMIVKTGEDLRHDWLASILLRKCMSIWQSENVPCWLRPYEVIVCNKSGGLIEAIPNVISIHQIKKSSGISLSDYFKKKFTMLAKNYNLSYVFYQKNFVRSLAGYSIFQYLFRVKDRHNENIMLDEEGHIIHIDFGYLLDLSPRNIAFETSPFKLIYDFVEIMDGMDSYLFLYYRSLVTQGLFVLRSHVNEILALLEILCYGQPMACMSGGTTTLKALRDRFLLHLSDVQFGSTVTSLIDHSLASYTTKLYDHYQYYTNGIL